MRIFIDTEFMENGATETVKLLSLAMVTTEGKALYLVVIDAPRGEANEFGSEYVIPYLDLPPGDGFTIDSSDFDRYQSETVDGVRYVRIHRGEAGAAVRAWVAEQTPSPEFWAWFGDYDWVALCQLFGSMVSLPVNWPMFCRDLRQENPPPFPDDLLRTGPKGLPEHHALADAWELRDRYTWLRRERLACGTR